MKQFVIKSVLFTLCVCAVAMASTPFVRTAGEAVKGVVDAVYDGKNPAPQVTNADIESCLIACSTLKTAEYDFESEYHYEQDGFLWFTGEECDFIYSGTVSAGIEDLSDIQVRINHDKQTIEVYMPEVVILGTPTIDFDNFIPVDERTGWFSDITLEEQAEIFSQCCDHQLERAEEAGIISEAKTQTETIVSNLLSTFLADTELAGYKPAVMFGVEAPTEVEAESESHIDVDVLDSVRNA